MAKSLMFFILLVFSVLAQVASRTEEIEGARQARTSQLAPDDTSRLERFLVEVKQRYWVERATAGIAGFRLKFGGLVSGSGFALGPEYLRRDLAEGAVVIRAFASASAKL